MLAQQTEFHQKRLRGIFPCIGVTGRVATHEHFDVALQGLGSCPGRGAGIDDGRHRRDEIVPGKRNLIEQVEGVVERRCGVRLTHQMRVHQP